MFGENIELGDPLLRYKVTGWHLSSKFSEDFASPLSDFVIETASQWYIRLYFWTLARDMRDVNRARKSFARSSAPNFYQPNRRA